MTTLADLAKIPSLNDIPMAIVRELVSLFCSRGKPVNLDEVDNEKLFKHTAWLIWRAAKRLGKADFVDPSTHTIRIFRGVDGRMGFNVCEAKNDLPVVYSVRIGLPGDPDGTVTHALFSADGILLHKDTTWPNFAKYFKQKPQPLAEAACPKV